MRKPIRKRIRNREHDQIEQKTILDTTLIIGFLTLAGYYVAFSYEKGYKSYFHLGDVFLDNVTLVHVLIAITAMSGTFFLLYPIYSYFAYGTVDPLLDYIFKRVMLQPLLIFCFIAALFPLEKTYIIFSSVVAGIGLLLNTIAPFFRKEKGYINKIKAYENEKKNNLLSHIDVDAKLKVDHFSAHR